GRFRDDLYYRLQVVSINIPPLRERGEDVFVLAEQFLQKFNSLHQSRFTEISAPVQEIFRRYSWPGNVRELSNLLERICILEEGERILEGHLPPRIVREVAQGRAVNGGQAGAAPGMASSDYFGQTAQFQKQLIEAALQRTQGRLGPAAETLGLSRHALRHQ